MIVPDVITSFLAGVALGIFLGGPAPRLTTWYLQQLRVKRVR